MERKLADYDGRPIYYFNAADSVRRITPADRLYDDGDDAPGIGQQRAQNVHGFDLRWSRLRLLAGPGHGEGS